MPGFKNASVCNGWRINNFFKSLSDIRPSTMIYIVMPVFNQWNFTIACLNSLSKQTIPNFKTIVVDHGSTDRTSDMIITKFSEVILLKAHRSLWWAGATNLGVKKALELSQSDDDYILTLNNDLIVDPDYLESIFSLTRTNNKILIGSVCVDRDNNEKIIFAGVLWNGLTAKYTPALKSIISYSGLRLEKNFIESDLLPGRGTLIPITAFKEIGLYDEINFPHYAADEDFSLRCKKAGYKIIVSVKAVVKSHIRSTGLNNKFSNLSLSQFLSSLQSIKSPNNLSKRWIWARKHAIVPPLYFLFDLSRIFFSHFKK
jgi:GT2 family glycosyltransferase